MSPVFSTPAGATVTYLSSTWPWSLHASSSVTSRNMTFWNDLLSVLAQISLFSSTTVATTTFPEPIQYVSTTIATTVSVPTATSTPFRPDLKPQGNARESLKESINQTKLNPFGDFVGTESSVHDSALSSTTAMNDVNMRNVTSSLLINGGSSSSHIGNFTTENVLSSLVDCSDFTEQKLLNIVICSIGDVNNNFINGTSATENNAFNETFRNISDDLIRIYNNNSNFSNGSEYEVAGNGSITGIKATQFESTIYFIQVVTTAVLLGIIILATVIGE